MNHKDDECRKEAIKIFREKKSMSECKFLIASQKCLKTFIPMLLERHNRVVEIYNELLKGKK